VTTDALLRSVAILAAVVVAAAPFAGQIKTAAARAIKAIQARRAGLTRLTVALALLAVGSGVIPLPHLPASSTARITVETPSQAMQSLVQPVAAAFKGASQVDRALWAETWSKAALVVAGEATTTQVAFTDTRSLREFTALAVDIAWRRIGGHVPGSQESLRKAVEAAYGTAVGTEVVPVTDEVRAAYVEFAKAVAWAGVNGG
jgi:hypothetical protein